MIQEKVIIPLLKAAITGFLFALFIAAFFITPIPWRVFGLVLAGVCLISWLVIIIPTQEKPIRIYQSTTPLKLAITWNDGQAGLFSEIGITREQFISWAAGVAAGRSLGENHWTGSVGIFSKGEYHQFRDELERRGLLRAKGRHHAQGFELTGKGRAVCAEIARRFDAHAPHNQLRTEPEKNPFRLLARDSERGG